MAVNGIQKRRAGRIYARGELENNFVGPRHFDPEATRRDQAAAKPAAGMDETWRGFGAVIRARPEED